MKNRVKRKEKSVRRCSSRRDSHSKRKIKMAKFSKGKPATVPATPSAAATASAAAIRAKQKVDADAAAEAERKKKEKKVY